MGFDLPQYLVGVIGVVLGDILDVVGFFDLLPQKCLLLFNGNVLLE